MENLDPLSYTLGMRRSDKTMIRVKRGIAELVRKYKVDGSALLEIGANHGTQTVRYYEEFNNPQRLVGYDWHDFLDDSVRGKINLSIINIEYEKFPDADSSFDVVVCNQVLEHIKNIYTPLSEMWRVLKNDGLLILSVPNLACWHNCGLLMLGQQPTTISIKGSHIRGYAIWSMTRYLLKNDLFKLRELRGYGFPPFFKVRVYGPLKTYCHTPVWALTKTGTIGQTWEEERKTSFTTTSFFDDQTK